MGSSHSSLENISLNTNTNLQKELVSKCEEFSAQNNSRVWKGLSHALQKVTLSNEGEEIDIQVNLQYLFSCSNSLKFYLYCNKYQKP